MRAALLGLLFVPGAAWAFQVPGFEPVQTVPVETMLADPELRSAAELWPKMISKAEHSIDIEQFYLTPKDGEPLDPVLKALREAGRRGVKIRLLLEGKFEKVSKTGIEAVRSIPNLELRVLEFSKVKEDGIIHAKFFIVDGRTAYLGSQNFDWRSLKHIHEMGLRITDRPVVDAMSAVFRHDWSAYERLSKGRPVIALNRKRPAARTGERAYLVASPWAYNPPGVGDSETELVRLIDTCEKELAVELLEYAPLTRKGAYYGPIDGALRAAAARGVRVRLLVSHWNTERPHLDHLKSLVLIPGIEIKIATIPPAKQGPIPFARVVHAKTMVIDGRTLWLGTSNWSGGYLDNSRNLEIVVKDEALAAKMLEVHKRLWDSPYSEDLDVARVYPKPKK